MITLAIGILIVTVVVIFSVQNAMPVVVGFLAWKFEASLAVIILLSVLMGMLLGGLMVSFWRFKRSQRDKKTKDQISIAGDKPL